MTNTQLSWDNKQLNEPDLLLFTNLASDVLLTATTKKEKHRNVELTTFSPLNYFTHERRFLTKSTSRWPDPICVALQQALQWASC
jgi:hypothetical protein